MDDVDAVQAQIARNMIASGDWVTPRLDGVLYLEKSPLIYWEIAGCYEIFGVHDWVARIPVAVFSIGLALLTAAFGMWAFGRQVGQYAGLVIATCIGLFLFTRIQIPDVMLTFTITLAMWAMLRALDEDERRPKVWAYVLWISLGVGLLLKSLIGLLFPVGTGLIYLLVTRKNWRRLRPVSGLQLMLVIAVPWHVLAAVRNPPVFDFTMRSIPGQYHGFLWFYFINEQLLRFLNLRSPRDYDTVPRPLFWLFHLLWLFPWSVYLPAVFKAGYKPVDRESDIRFFTLCWIGFVMVFFTFSTTQEYYSMPAYPAFAILIGSAMAESGQRAWRWATRSTAVIAGCAAVAIGAILFASWSYPTPGDIAQALTSHPSAYTLSLGHMGDLTIRSFAYLRLPLAVAGIAMLIGAAGAWKYTGGRAAFALAIMMVLFYQAARLALIAFDPYLGSYDLAQALNKSPNGGLIVDDPYYEMSTIFFYTNRSGLILNGRVNNLEYGSYAPGAPQVFIDNAGFVERWKSPQRWYVASEDERADRLRDLVGASALHPIATSGGKTIYTNR